MFRKLQFGLGQKNFFDSFLQKSRTISDYLKIFCQILIPFRER